VAAVADWRVANASDQKLKKEEGGAAPQLRIRTEPDILASVAARSRCRAGPIASALPPSRKTWSSTAPPSARKKAFPLLVGNIGHHTFGQDDNAIVLFDENGHTVLPRPTS
jgi:phosphopantothenoylcysteine decarboxylase/phosphopantothenate--cysteine ligase